MYKETFDYRRMIIKSTKDKQDGASKVFDLMKCIQIDKEKELILEDFNRFFLNRQQYLHEVVFIGAASKNPSLKEKRF